MELIGHGQEIEDITCHASENIVSTCMIDNVNDRSYASWYQSAEEAKH